MFNFAPLFTANDGVTAQVRLISYSVYWFRRDKCDCECRGCSIMAILWQYYVDKCMCWSLLSQNYCWSWSRIPRLQNTETSPESARANIALSRLQPRKQTAWKTCSSVLRDIYTPALSTPTLVSHYAVNELQQSDGTLMDICIPEEGYWHYWTLLTILTT